MREDLEQALADLEQMLEQKKSEMQSLDNQLSQTNRECASSLLITSLVGVSAFVPLLCR